MIPREHLESVRTALINAIGACDDLEFRVEEAFEHRDGHDRFVPTLFDIKDVVEDFRRCLRNGERAVSDRLREEADR